MAVTRAQLTHLHNALNATMAIEAFDNEDKANLMLAVDTHPQTIRWSKRIAEAILHPNSERAIELDGYLRMVLVLGIETGQKMAVAEGLDCIPDPDGQ